MCRKVRYTLELLGDRLLVSAEIPCLAGEEPPEVTLHARAGVRSRSKRCRGAESFLVIVYDTPVEGWLNILTEECFAVSLYSHAFPQGLPAYIDGSTCYFQSGFESYDIVDAYIDRETGLWAKDTNVFFGESANIAGVKRGNLRFIQKGIVKVFYTKEASYGNLYESAAIGEEAFAFYNKMYTPKEESVFKWLVLDIGDSSMYNRGNLVVAGGAPEDFCMPENVPEDFPFSESEYRLWLRYMLAHEVAHMWFCHADVDSYEDWLNETGAEWSAMMFLLERGDTGMFSLFYSLREYEHKTIGEAIMPEDKHHPASVHSSGVVLFYMLYKKYGANMVRKLLVILSKPENQSTDRFLSVVEKELGSEISGFVEAHLREKLPLL
ncbi:MAG: hypothetical protein NC180_01135 [Muribaculaceae bacterium]|nr:hypothetical protein [Roseburia sp.]MCM1431376.1 hypothetical protein [Muribaculaceae bacterium]MCM1491818.1 hypothetical protein [Muribaculaceae bacterium]